MRICFADHSNCRYDARTPLQAPLGGSQSAAVYLALELARLGHNVSLVNNREDARTVDGVSCLPLQQLTPRILRDIAADALVLLLGPSNAPTYRSLLPKARVILWTGHASDQPDVQHLRNPACLNALDFIAFVSEFQRRQFVQQFGLDPARTHVLKNAVAPAFLDLFKPGESILAAKARPPSLAYTSTPFRGLNVLLQVFPEIRRRLPEARLQVFSSMEVYQVSAPQVEVEHDRLYHQCRTTEGVEYVGSLPQPELAARMKAVSVLAYPNHFVETSCIALMEAMAAGCSIVSSDLGALPETAANFATLIPIVNHPPAKYRGEFVDAVISKLQTQSELAAHLSEQVAFANREYRWETRAREWVEWLKSMPPRALTPP